MLVVTHTKQIYTHEKVDEVFLLYSNYDETDMHIIHSLIVYFMQHLTQIIESACRHQSLGELASSSGSLIGRAKATKGWGEEKATAYAIHRPRIFVTAWGRGTSLGTRLLASLGTRLLANKSLGTRLLANKLITFRDTMHACTVAVRLYISNICQ